MLYRCPAAIRLPNYLPQQTANCLPCSKLFYQAQQDWYPATQPDLSLQPMIDIPLSQITGIRALYEKYEAMGARQLGYEGRVRRRAWKRGFVHRPLLKCCNYAIWAINFLSVDRDRSEIGVEQLESLCCLYAIGIVFYCTSTCLLLFNYAEHPLTRSQSSRPVCHDLVNAK